MNESEPLCIQYDAEPLEVDPTECKTVAALVKKAQKEFSPQLDSFPLAKLTLHRLHWRHQTQRRHENHGSHQGEWIY
jgi:hypothetical protein